jgi:hypothetical protein
MPTTLNPVMHRSTQHHDITITHTILKATDGLLYLQDCTRIRRGTWTTAKDGSHPTPFLTMHADITGKLTKTLKLEHNSMGYFMRDRVIKQGVIVLLSKIDIELEVHSTQEVIVTCPQRTGTTDHTDFTREHVNRLGEDTTSLDHTCFKVATDTRLNVCVHGYLLYVTKLKGLLMDKVYISPYLFHHMIHT